MQEFFSYFISFFFDYIKKAKKIKINFFVFLKKINEMQVYLNILFIFIIFA